MKHISIKYLYAELEDLVFFQITGQTHIGDEFSNFNREFTSSNRFKLSSSDSPKFREDEETLFVRGIRTEKNNEILVCNNEYFTKVLNTIREYNERFESSEIHQSHTYYFLTEG